MNFFIPGATGFIGSHLCKKLVDNGHKIYVLLRNENKTNKLPVQNIEYIKGDLLSFKNEDFIIPECDYVIHLAGVINVDTESDYEKYNYIAVKDLISCINRQKWKPKRFIFCSSLAAAGPSPRKTPLTEFDSCNPIESYGKAKRAAEVFLQSAPFPTTSFRPPIVLGPGDENSLLLFKMAKKGIGVMVSGNNQLVSFVDVEDLTNGIISIINDQSDSHKIYFTSADDNIDIRTLWDALGKSVNNKVIVLPIHIKLLYGMVIGNAILHSVFNTKNQLDIKKYKQMIQPAFICSNSLIKKELRWVPKHNIYESVMKAANWYSEYEML